MKGSGGHLRCRCVWWSRRGHLKVSLRLTTQRFLTWASQITYRTIYIQIILLLFPEGHNNGALCGAGTSWAFTGMLSVCLALKHSGAGHDWLHRLELRMSYREALHQGPSAWHRVLDTIKHVSQHRLLTASVNVASPCNGSCCMHQLGKSLAISFPPRIPSARGNQFYESTTFTHLDRSMSAQITA